MNAKDYGTSIRIARERRGWTQAELAIRAGLTQATISSVERGTGGMPRKATMDAIARACADAVTRAAVTDPIAVRLLDLAIELDRRSATGSASPGSSPFRRSRSEGKSRKGRG